MSFLTALANRPRLALGLAFILSGAGLLSWFTMPREEDPKLAQRFGMVIAPFPGADAAQVERLVVEPLEEELAEVEDVSEVRATIRSGVAILRVELAGRVLARDTDAVWEEVQDAVDVAYADMPDAALPPEVDHDLNATEAVLVAVTGPSDALALADAAEDLRRRLLGLDDVARVEVTGDPGEQITIAFDEATARRLRLPPEALARMLGARNVSLPGGDLHIGTRRVELRPEAELGSLEELRETPIVLPSGAAVPLRRIAEVRRTPEEPRRELARVDGEAAVVLGVVPRFRIEAVSFGREVRSLLDAFDAERDDVELTLIAFQPDKVEGRLGELGFSLLLGIGIVAGVLLLTMGPRLGLVVSSVVPLVTFASVAIYAVGGGVLHQMAVAALVISLGLLVDNAIVMAEAIQRRLDEGEPRGEAIGSTVRELAVPLASSTGTTLASFVPMLLAPGTTGDFTRAIPVVVMLTLCASLVYALVVTPVLSGLILRPSRGGSEGTVERLARTIGRFSVRRPLLTLLAVTLAVGASASFAPAVKKNFFPSSDREQLVVSVELPEGTHLDATDDVARRLEAALRARPEVRQLAAFVGRTTPSFYYNLPRQPQAPHLAQLVVTTGGAAEVGPVMDFVRAYAARTLPEAVVVANRLEQGPPIPAPVQVRLLGDDLSALHLASEEVRRALRAVEGTRDIRTDHGPGAPLLAYRIDDAAAARRGMARGQVALAMLGRTRGLPVGTYRAEDDPLPIRLRAPLADDQTPEGLEGAELVAEDGRRASVGALTTRSLRYAPAVIHHFDRARTVSVLSDVEEGETYQAIVAELTPMLDAIEWPDGVRWEFGGAIESSAEANANLGANGPLGALLLVSILLAQFNSLRRVGIVLFTAPLAVMGIWPGLLLFDLPFGFVALLGAIALIGIVVNGAIVLIDLADLQRAGGATVAEALEVAVTRRTRPILLTTITTIAGLMPLLFSASTLWPPLAAAMISGLSVATVLTLFAVPALYRLLFRDPETPAAAPEGAAS